MFLQFGDKYVPCGINLTVGYIDSDIRNWKFNIRNIVF